MAVIVNDKGFAADDFAGSRIPADALPANDLAEAAVEIGPDMAPEALAGPLLTASMIVIGFPSFADGRGFTLARLLRLRGYAGRLRASGHVLADQYAMARRAGFDEVEISDALAARQPEADWLARADWRAFDYRKRLSGAA